jgi:hypothetical protein
MEQQVSGGEIKFQRSEHTDPGGYPDRTIRKIQSSPKNNMAQEALEEKIKLHRSELEFGLVSHRDIMNEIQSSPKKTGHWIWWGFPTPPYKNASLMNQKYSLTPDQAEKYLKDEYLSTTLLERLQAIEGKSDIFKFFIDGGDLNKFRSCLRLFIEASIVIANDKLEAKNNIIVATIRDTILRIQNKMHITDLASKYGHKGANLTFLNEKLEEIKEQTGINKTKEIEDARIRLTIVAEESIKKKTTEEQKSQDPNNLSQETMVEKMADILSNNPKDLNPRMNKEKQISDISKSSKQKILNHKVGVYVKSKQEILRGTKYNLYNFQITDKKNKTKEIEDARIRLTIVAEESIKKKTTEEQKSQDPNNLSQETMVEKMADILSQAISFAVKKCHHTLTETEMGIVTDRTFMINLIKYSKKNGGVANATRHLKKPLKGGSKYSNAEHLFTENFPSCQGCNMKSIFQFCLFCSAEYQRIAAKCGIKTGRSPEEGLKECIDPVGQRFTRIPARCVENVAFLAIKKYQSSLLPEKKNILMPKELTSLRRRSILTPA